MEKQLKATRQNACKLLERGAFATAAQMALQLYINALDINDEIDAKSIIKLMQVQQDLNELAEGDC